MRLYGDSDGNDHRTNRLFSEEADEIATGKIRNERRVLKFFDSAEEKTVENEEFRVEPVRILGIQREQIHDRNGERNAALFERTAQIRQSLVSKKDDVVPVRLKMLRERPLENEERSREKRLRK